MRQTESNEDVMWVANLNLEGPTSEHYLKDELYKEVQDNSRLFEFIQQGSLDGIWYWDLKDRTQEWMSPRFWEIFGIDPAQKRHSPTEWQGLLHPDDLQTALNAFDAHVGNPSIPYDVQLRYRHAAGHWVWVRCRGIVLRDADGAPHRMLGAHTDITDLKTREALLERALEEVRDTNTAFRQFASVASHDLRGPMMAVAQLAEILREDLSDKVSERQARMLELIRSRSETLALLLNSMLEYVTVSSDAKTETPKAVDLRTTIEDAFGIYCRESDRLEITGDAVAEAVPSHVQTAFRNLVSNAIKHHGGDGVTITVTLREIAGTATVLFDDDGPGIAEEHRSVVFELFRALHPQTVEKGVGLGLALARRLLTQSLGDIGITDKDTPGTRFVVRLPAYKPPPN